jgi:putative SOS response-associated peptidase YedK
MCGRFTLSVTQEELFQAFGIAPEPPHAPRYNVAPTQEVLALVPGAGADAAPAAVRLRWGLVPPWADPATGARLINARAETIAEKPAFRSAFRRRRCLVLADGFYEWQRTPEGKVPMRIRLRSGRPFALAGIWEVKPGEPELRTCAIITTAANRFMAPIHDRMPVLLQGAAAAAWLAEGEAAALAGLLVPCADDELEAYPVSRLVNAPANDVPACLAPAG